MSSGAQHYAEAERRLTEAGKIYDSLSALKDEVPSEHLLAMAGVKYAEVSSLAAIAQAHAALAEVAAAVEIHSGLFVGDRWRKVLA